MMQHMHESLGFVFLCMATTPVLAAAGSAPSKNIAPLASISGQGTDLHAVVDGVKQRDGSGEWIGGSQNLWFGWIHYPKNLELKWDSPQRINKVVIYDRQAGPAP